ncbi:YkuS family protein [Clostridium sp.]|uniref:YkuS family protein n=1 Tax=Clostridium sp. TaxID=1506 RepID=UPI001A51CFF8|nr:YkuS family protein [Clostridium sp.]MBK5234363.1 YkuS family protein [Clostridium sp.]
MVICISQELQYLQDELIKRGYTVINNRDNNTYCDAIICNLKDGGLINLNMQNNIKREGTLIIDSGSKNIDEIEDILTNRVYSSLF